MNEELWASRFGDEYTERNKFDWSRRKRFWRYIMAVTGASSVFEVGCNVGNNLLAIRDVDPSVRVIGIDVNETALAQADSRDLAVCKMAALDINWMDAFDLVFTVGVLIHIPPKDLEEVMRNIRGATRRFVLAVEYEAKDETMVQYRGRSDALWKRPYGDLLAAGSLAIRQTGFLSKDDGFDDCTYWLLEKQ
jgi:pseudaminic acid biosynthesis-associated methylase